MSALNFDYPESAKETSSDFTGGNAMGVELWHATSIINIVVRDDLEAIEAQAAPLVVLYLHSLGDSRLLVRHGWRC